MSVRDGTERRVSFNARDELGDKIDKLTLVMSKLTARDSHKRKPFKPQIYQSREWNRPYGQGGYQNRSNSSQMIVQDRIIEATDSEEIPEGIVDRVIEEITRMKDRITIIEIEIGLRERNSTRNNNNSRDRSSSNSRSRVRV